MKFPSIFSRPYQGPVALASPTTTHESVYADLMLSAASGAYAASTAMVELPGPLLLPGPPLSWPAPKEPKDSDVEHLFCAIHEAFTSSGCPLQAILREDVRNFLRDYSRELPERSGKDVYFFIEKPPALEVVKNELCAIFRSPHLASLGDGRIPLLRSLLDLCVYFNRPPVWANTLTPRDFTAVAAAIRHLLMHPELFSASDILELGALLCTPPASVQASASQSAQSFQSMLDFAAPVTESNESIVALSRGILHLPPSVRLDAIRIVYKYGTKNLLHVRPRILESLDWLDSAGFARLDNRLRAALPLPDDAQDRVFAILHLAMTEPVIGQDACAPSCDRNTGEVQLPPLPPANASATLVEQTAAIDAAGVLHNGEGVAQVRLLSTIARIDGILGSIEVGLNLRDNTLCCLKGLTYGLPFATSDSCIMPAVRRDYFVGKLRTEAKMAAACGSPLTPTQLYTTPVDAWLQMPLMLGSLDSLIYNDVLGGDRPLALLLGMRRVLAQLAGMHARNLVHRDIKPGNILHRGTSDLQLADFELVQHCKDSKSSFGGTPVFEAPEQKQHRKLGNRPWQLKSLKPADVYGVGTTFAALLRNGLFARRMVETFKARRRLMDELETPGADSGLNPHRTKAAVRNLIADMISPWPALRPTAARALARLDALLSGAKPFAGEHYWAMVAGYQLRRADENVREAGLSRLPPEARDAQIKHMRW